VTIKGRDRRNPLLFVVHGGPGNPLTGLADFLYPNWEEDFTIVHYDQRGAGRNHARNLPVVELSMAILAEYELDLEILARDGAEMARYVCDYLGAERMILSGTSWGSALAVEIYQREPQLFSA